VTRLDKKYQKCPILTWRIHYIRLHRRLENFDCVHKHENMHIFVYFRAYLCLQRLGKIF
jgi:hypothetical protein